MKEESGLESMRLQKFLSRAGVASRREGERWIAAGRVKVNGEVVTTQGVQVVPERDRVEVDGKAVTLSPVRWLLLNKPSGVLTTRDDPGGRRTVYDLLPEDARELVYVGRLDRDTEGLLILTNEGDMVNSLLHPSSRVAREYRAWVVGEVQGAALKALREGVELEDGPARAEDVRVLRSGRGRSHLSLVLREGRKREVRRLLEAVGHPVRGLKRVRFGPLELGNLPRGSWRTLEEAEVEALRRAVSPSTSAHKAGPGPSG